MMSSCYHLTIRKSKDHKPKVYGEVCKSQLYHLKVACANIQGVLITIYASPTKPASVFGNFITACLPKPLDRLYTQTTALCLVASEPQPRAFWESLSSYQDVVLLDAVHHRPVTMTSCLP